MSEEESKPGRDYNVPDLPDEGVDQQTKYILELYAHEIRDHASGILSIYGLSPSATDQYKKHCFDAANALEGAARILRNNGKIRDVHIVKEATPISLPKVEYVHQVDEEQPQPGGKSQQGRGWSALGKFFTRAMTP